MRGENEVINYSIIIVTYNRIDKLRKCVECALVQKEKANHIIVVNNNSTDGTKSYLDTLYSLGENIMVFHLDENIGGAGGFAYGVKVAFEMGDDWILMIDDDAMLRDDYVSMIVPNIKSGIFAYSGIVIEHNKISLTHRRRLIRPFMCKQSWVPVSEYDSEYFDYDISSFCGLMISKEIIKKVGIPREDFFIWYDDTEYSFRFHKYSKIRNINKAILDHETNNLDIEASRYIHMDWKYYYGNRNLLVINRINVSRLSFYCQLLKFRVRQILLIIFGIRHRKEFTYMINNCKIINDAIRDAKKNNMGINTNYLPS